MKYTTTLRSISTAILLAVVVLYGCQSSNPAVPAAGTATSQLEILRELNYARTNPRAYARELEAVRTHFRGILYQEPGRQAIRTQEGVAAVDEAINYLRSAAAVGPLQYSAGLEKAAADHVRDTGPKGIVSHTGSDGSSPRDRVERYGQWFVTMGENIAYGPFPSARRIVMQLIIDDGVADRGHRETIFNPDFRLVGIATGSHKAYGFICVQEFAGGFRESVAAGNGAL